MTLPLILFCCVVAFACGVLVGLALRTCHPEIRRLDREIAAYRREIAVYRLKQARELRMANALRVIAENTRQADRNQKLP
jgi:hypothetical protein